MIEGLGVVATLFTRRFLNTINSFVQSVMTAYAIHEPRKSDGLRTRITDTVTLFSEQFPVFLYSIFTFGDSALAPEGSLRSVNSVGATLRRQARKKYFTSYA